MRHTFKTLYKMKFSTSLSTITFICTILLVVACNPKTYDFNKNYDTAYDLQFVKELNGNNLFIKLVNNKEIIDNYRNRGKEKSATGWEAEDAKYNAAIVQAFKDSWSYCDVFFYTDELYFNTREFPVTDINGKKHIVELEREQIFLGKFLEFCNTVSVADVGRNRYQTQQTHLFLEKWPEDGSRMKKTVKLEAAGCLTKSNIKFLVGQMQKQLTRTYEGKNPN